MSHLSNVSIADLNEIKKQYQGKDLDIVLNKIENGYPVQYVIGNVNFCGNKIIVNENVLIPRYETEFLVELIKNTISSEFQGNIVDLGTGSGCIAITLGKIFKNSDIKGIDISCDAIDVANINKKNNEVTNVTFEAKDMLDIENFDDFDIIVSNPPYVSYSEETGIETKYEPQNAIFADDDGLLFYKEIIKKVSLSMVKPKHIFFEIGMNQASKIKEYSKIYLDDYKVDVYQDLSKKDRYVHIYLNK